MNTYVMKCKNCQGTLSLNEQKRILYCPYCGSQELIEISDEILKEQIRAQTQRTISQNELDTQLQMKQMDMEAKKKKEDERSGRFALFLLFLFPFVIMLLKYLGSLIK